MSRPNPAIPHETHTAAAVHRDTNVMVRAAAPPACRGTAALSARRGRGTPPALLSGMATTNRLPGSWPLTRLRAVLASAAARSLVSGRPCPVTERVLARLEGVA